MTRTLYLMRHAEAADGDSRENDKFRDLTQAGIRESLHMGAWLAETHVSFDLILTSSAVRAAKTGSIVAEGMKLDSPPIVHDDVLYNASVRQLLGRVNNLDDSCHRVLCVCHNPAVSYLAEYLTKAEIGTMPPCSLAIITFDIPAWMHVTENSGVLERLVTPDVVARF